MLKGKDVRCVDNRDRSNDRNGSAKKLERTYFCHVYHISVTESLEKFKEAYESVHAFSFLNNGNDGCLRPPHAVCSFLVHGTVTPCPVMSLKEKMEHTGE